MKKWFYLRFIWKWGNAEKLWAKIYNVLFDEIVACDKTPFVEVISSFRRPLCWVRGHSMYFGHCIRCGFSKRSNTPFDLLIVNKLRRWYHG